MGSLSILYTKNYINDTPSLITHLEGEEQMTRENSPEKGATWNFDDVNLHPLDFQGFLK